jgi:hypothetical protein
MTWKLFLDDEREPIGEDWFIARSYDEAVGLVYLCGLPSYISFDHDLGPGKDGLDFAKWLVEYVMDNGFGIPQYFVHSQNPVGRENIERYLEGFLEVYHG